MAGRTSGQEDLVLEIRRVMRRPEPGLVFIVNLGRVPWLDINVAMAKLVRNLLLALFETQDGAATLCPSGNLVGYGNVAGRFSLAALQEAILDLVFPDQPPRNGGEGVVEVFRLPDQYTEIRERLQEEYQPRPAEADARDLATRILSGPLNANNLGFVQRVIASSQVGRYLADQNACRTAHDGGWAPVMREYHFDVAQMTRRLLPNLEFVATERFFFEVCRVLDRRMVTEQLDGVLDAATLPVSINLVTETLHTADIQQRLAALPLERRGRLAVELQHADLLSNLPRGLAAIEWLRRHAIQVIIDGIGLATLPYVRLDLFTADRFKIVVDDEAFSALTVPTVVKGLRRIGVERIVFSRCEDLRAIRVGEALGVTLYQGRLIDRLTASA